MTEATTDGNLVKKFFLFKHAHMDLQKSAIV